MKRFLPIAAAAALTACAPQPPQTLEEKLASKSPEQRQEILRVACLNEAEHLGNESKETRTAHGAKLDQNTAQTRRLKAICRQMAAENAPNRQKWEATR